MDLAEFLLARIAEDEAAAHWVQASERIADAVGKPGSLVRLEPGVYARPDSPHVAWGDPARVLAECEAKRRIVDEWREAKVYYDTHRSVPAGELHGLETALKHLATAYADHPDYAGLSATV